MRSSRKKVAHQYNDSESDSEFLMPEVEGEQCAVMTGVSMIVERVLGRKMMKNPEAESETDELFFIKWKKVRLATPQNKCTISYDYDLQALSALDGIQN